MECRLETCNDVDVIHLAGHLDLVSSQALKDLIHERLVQNRLSVILNLQSVDFLNSSGLGTLVSALKDTKQSGGQLVLCSLAPYIQEIFYITQLSGVFEIHTDQTEAIAAFAAPRPATTVAI